MRKIVSPPVPCDSNTGQLFIGNHTSRILPFVSRKVRQTTLCFTEQRVTIVSRGQSSPPFIIAVVVAAALSRYRRFALVGTISRDRAAFCRGFTIIVSREIWDRNGFIIDERALDN